MNVHHSLETESTTLGDQKIKGRGRLASDVAGNGLREDVATTPSKSTQDGTFLTPEGGVPFRCIAGEHEEGGGEDKNFDQP